MVIRTLLLSLMLSGPAWAQDMSAWSDQTVCRLVKTHKHNAAYLLEAKTRGLACAASKAEGQGAKQSRQLVKSEGIRIYPVVLAAKDQQRLMSQAINKTAFDFSPYDMLDVNPPMVCEFRLRRVVYEEFKEGMMEHWNMARGKITFAGKGVDIDGKWRMNGLSKDAGYLKNEVNLGLTKQGHLVGKMAYFHLKIDPGEAPRKPLYVALTPHQRSQPLDLQNPKFAEFWIDVEDWAGGALRIWSCNKVY